MRPDIGTMTSLSCQFAQWLKYLIIIGVNTTERGRISDPDKSIVAISFDKSSDNSKVEEDVSIIEETRSVSEESTDDDKKLDKHPEKNTGNETEYWN